MFPEDGYPAEVEEPDSHLCSGNGIIGMSGRPAINRFDVPWNSWRRWHRSLWHREVPASDIQPGSYGLVKVQALQPYLMLLFLPGRITQGAGGTRSLTQPMSALTNHGLTLPK